MLARSKAWVYLVDVDSAALKAAGLRRLQERTGVLERQQQQPGPEQAPAAAAPAGVTQRSGAAAEPVVVVGCGPAGLFAALELAQAGIKVGLLWLLGGLGGWWCMTTYLLPPCAVSFVPLPASPAPCQISLLLLRVKVVLLDRGQPVEVRGKDIGALFVRRHVNPESNLCYGEGGAGALCCCGHAAPCCVAVLDPTLAGLGIQGLRITGSCLACLMARSFSKSMPGPLLMPSLLHLAHASAQAPGATAS